MRLKVCGKAFDGIGVMAWAGFADDDETGFEVPLVVVSHPCKAKALTESPAMVASIEDNFVMSTYLYIHEDATKDPLFPRLYRDCDVDITEVVR